jgi:hypothetical protein
VCTSERRSLPLLADSHPIGNQMEGVVPVGPLSSQWMMWWMSHQRAGTEHLGKAHPPSRRIAADRGGEGAGGACHVQWFTPGTQHYWDNPASRASRRVISVLIGPPSASWAEPIRPCSTGRADGEHDLGAFPALGGELPLAQCAGREVNEGVGVGLRGGAQVDSAGCIGRTQR